jgi:hypothetical protein
MLRDYWSTFHENLLQKSSKLVSGKILKYMEKKVYFLELQREWSCFQNSSATFCLRGKIGEIVSGTSYNTSSTHSKKIMIKNMVVKS